jgi:pimeloyl-ACP methyl ester carboxylesterase
MKKQITTEDGLSLWSEAFGKSTDRPILLIMGAMNQGIFWPDEFCHELANAGNFVIRYDHRDTGKSSAVDFQKHPYDLNVLTKDAVAVLRGYEIKRAVIVGLSMGGYVAQLLAIDHPDSVERLVLISTSADQRPYMAATMGRASEVFSLPPPQEKLLAYIRSSVAHPPQTAREMDESLIHGWEVTYGGSRAFPREQIASTLRLAAQRSADPTTGFHHALAVDAAPDRLQSIKRIQAPTLIIHGKYDVCFPLEHAQYLEKNIPKSQLKIFEMGHSFMWSWSNEVSSAILNFIHP